MKLWQANVRQVQYGVVNVWMPDDADAVAACAEATRYAGVLEANGYLHLDSTPDPPEIMDAELDEITAEELGGPDSATYMSFNLDPKFANTESESDHLD